MAYDDNDGRTVAHLLLICERVPGEFTLKEIVARIIDERPDEIMDFAIAWGKLIHTKRIRVCKHGRPTLYRVVREEE